MNGFRLCCHVVWMTSLRRYSKASGGSASLQAFSTDNLPRSGAEPLFTDSFTSRSANPSSPEYRTATEKIIRATSPLTVTLGWKESASARHPAHWTTAFPLLSKSRLPRAR